MSTESDVIVRMRIAHTEELERVAREHPNLGISEDETRDLAMLAAVRKLYEASLEISGVCTQYGYLKNVIEDHERRAGGKVSPEGENGIANGWERFGKRLGWKLTKKFNRNYATFERTGSDTIKYRVVVYYGEREDIERTWGERDD